MRLYNSSFFKLSRILVKRKNGFSCAYNNSQALVKPKLGRVLRRVYSVLLLESCFKARRVPPLKLGNLRPTLLKEDARRGDDSENFRL
jgi:hypothetical protein